MSDAWVPSEGRATFPARSNCLCLPDCAADWGRSVTSGMGCILHFRTLSDVDRVRSQGSAIRNPEEGFPPHTAGLVHCLVPCCSVSPVETTALNHVSRKKSRLPDLQPEQSPSYATPRCLAASKLPKDRYTLRSMLATVFSAKVGGHAESASS